MGLEILLAVLENIKVALAIIATLLALGCIGVGIRIFVETGCTYDEESKARLEKAKGLWPKLVLAATIIGLFQIVPSLSDIWKVRIGLIKYKLASPENIVKATDEITRIGHELECKYLDCPKPKSK